MKKPYPYPPHGERQICINEQLAGNVAAVLVIIGVTCAVLAMDSLLN